ncbi:Phr protein [Bacillus cereus group sp. BfR-BA-01700]|nr:Phr protein [Bacillus cereus group sp. BfR-BA-01700]MDX5840996.1 Phr protein [Bacillus cereus group sp. BfR-BA-01700]
MKKTLIGLMGIVTILTFTIGLSNPGEVQKFIQTKVVASEGDYGG